MVFRLIWLWVHGPKVTGALSKVRGSQLKRAYAGRNNGPKLTLSIWRPMLVPRYTTVVVTVTKALHATRHSLFQPLLLTDCVIAKVVVLRNAIAAHLIPAYKIPRKWKKNRVENEKKWYAEVARRYWVATRTRQNLRNATILHKDINNNNTGAPVFKHEFSRPARGSCVPHRVNYFSCTGNTVQKWWASLTVFGERPKRLK